MDFDLPPAHACHPGPQFGIAAKCLAPGDSFVRSFHDCMTAIFSPADRPLPAVGSGQWGGQAPEAYRRNGG